MEAADRAPSDGPRCLLCGRRTFDPAKRERPWVRAVEGGRLVLICPACQETTPAWAEAVDRCRACGSSRLSAMLGEVVCRECGSTQVPTGA